MQHTLVAVFDNRTDAQSAMNELLSSGFTRTDVRLSTGDASDDLSATGSLGSDNISATRATDLDRSADGDTGITASIKNFFNDLFGSDNAEHASRYEGALSRGHQVLTLTADSLPEVERAADIVERYGPTDIDETSSGTPGLTSGMSAGAMGLGAGAGLQQSSSMSSQSASSGQSSSSVQAAAIPELDNPGDRKIFQQQSLNQAEPMGTTYQEPQGTSGLTATGGTSLQGSTLQENAIQGSSLDGTVNSGTTPLGGSALGAAAAPGGASLNATGAGSQQRDTALGGADTSGLGVTGSSSSSSSGSLSGSSSLDKQRSGTRIFSRDRSDAGSSMGSSSNPVSGVAASSSTGTGIDDDSYFRDHFNSTYSANGGKYDDYLPAYSYGSDMARSDRYTNRAWDDVETDLRSDWETRNASDADQSTWEKMKAAVRAGWDRITSDDDDDQYRSHYSSTYEGSGTTFNEVKPAYSYGSDMRKSDMYRNRPWDDVETDLRSGWDNRVDGTREFSTTGSDSSEPSTWDRVKNAVRHGWDKMSDEDDVYYRNHWNSVYGAGGESYDAYQPAYSYGSSMASDDKYRGRDWNDVENDLRTDWDTRYPGEQSTWEKMKSAVRAGWDRMMR